VQFSLFEPLHLQSVGLAGLQQRINRGVQVPMLLAQEFDMAEDRLALLVGQFILRHVPAPSNSPRDAGAHAWTMRAPAAARKSGGRNENYCDKV
jgi:hypothetical protein